MTWKEYKPGNIVEFPFSLRWWQKRLEEDQYVNVAEYEHNGVKSYELEMQICKGKLAINITLFTYDKLDFKKFEKDARWVLRSLKPKK